ncbi:MAG: hypothetical protein NTX14_04370 [Candidatus Nealsonbacteria bacterium]|jgi:hypothetical protein|nr:hypothetical protein [Candidatus Nealsonbacteria bacterium]
MIEKKGIEKKPDESESLEDFLRRMDKITDNPAFREETRQLMNKMRGKPANQYSQPDTI